MISSEKEYRELVMDSSSSLKDFSFNRKLYYKKWVLKEPVEEKDSDAAITGRVVETLLLEKDKFDDKFHFSACANIPTGLMLAFVQALYKYYVDGCDENGELIKSFEDVARKAYEESGFKISFEAVLKKFEGSDAEIYFNELKLVKSKGLTVVSVSDVTFAERVVDTLENHFVTRDVFGKCEDGECFNQFPIEGYDVEGHKFKSLVDRIIFNNKTKTIQVIDLKCVWDVENFYEKYYLYRHAYIQAYLYYRAVKHLTTTDPRYYGWKALPPQFVVCDSANYYAPLIYVLDEADLEEAFQGFEYKGKKYRGVKYLIGDLNWAFENNEWGMSAENYFTNGLVKLRP